MTLLGKAHIHRGEKILRPMDFTHKNAFSLADMQGFLQRLLFPAAYPEQQRLSLAEQDYAFLYEYLSMVPRASPSPAYSEQEFHDSYAKFLLFGDRTTRIPKHLKIYNKVGDAYGFLIDNAYVVDVKHQLEFFLSAVIYVNDNQTFNDDHYQYDTIGMPFLAAVGRIIYEYERQRPRSTSSAIKFLN